ncbi:hypothetical protein V6N13_023100 [Hibiscus sabdariffa]
MAENRSSLVTFVYASPNPTKRNGPMVLLTDGCNMMIFHVYFKIIGTPHIRSLTTFIISVQLPLIGTEWYLALLTIAKELSWLDYEVFRSALTITEVCF